MSSIKSVIKLVEAELKEVEKELINILPQDINLVSQVGSYMLQTGGKRFRPLLHLLVSKFCDYKGEKHIPVACVLEYIHTATLLHDDVIDNAEIRRGNLSANSLWGDKASVLVGDFLFSKAFSVMIDIGEFKILELFSKTTTKMAEAEAIQLSRAWDMNISEQDYLYLISNKTASLISAASESGAILAGVNSEKRKALRDYGHNLGVAFQLIDDYFDYFSTQKTIGKQIGKDFQEGNITLPLIYTLKNASSEDKKQIIDILEKRLFDEKHFNYVVEKIKKYNGDRYILMKAKEYITRAKSALEVFDHEESKWSLIVTADYIIDRQS